LINAQSVLFCYTVLKNHLKCVDVELYKKNDIIGPHTKVKKSSLFKNVYDAEL